ncbi:MAG: protein-L-isoaspartate O-methyltransferase [Rhodospirillaceae bacterium]|nr:protein-L-isoaspartate O-methyltransferase [Rhodospirillaceae bacterium]
MSEDARKIRLIMELRSQGVSDTEVLSAMERVPRELFVPEAFQDQAYENIALPIGAGQTISQPKIVAEMTSALELGPRLKVLEVGTGSGYQAAVLAHLCRRLYTVERHRTLADEAETRFAQLRLGNIVIQVGDGSEGWPAQAPFDRIIVTAQAVMLPDILLAQLREGGVMILPIVEKGQGQKVVRLRRTEKGIERETLMDARFVPLLDGLPRAK